jgi:hypothetical protein
VGLSGVGYVSSNVKEQGRVIELVGTLVCALNAFAQIERNPDDDASRCYGAVHNSTIRAWPHHKRYYCRSIVLILLPCCCPRASEVFLQSRIDW